MLKYELNFLASRDKSPINVISQCPSCGQDIYNSVSKKCWKCDEVLVPYRIIEQDENKLKFHTHSLGP